MQLFPFLPLALSLAHSLAVSGSSVSSYVQFPVQKLASIPNIASQYTSGIVFKRGEASNSTLVHEIGLYAVKMEIGTPPQTVYLQLDTGSSDMYVNDADSAYCELLSDGSDYVSTDNYELTATFSELPSSTVSAEAYNTLCSYWGAFSPSNSSTFKYNDTFFDETYGDGISLPAGEYTDSLENAYNITPFEYRNFPMALKSYGKIEKMAYSLFLNEPEAHFGSILFGAVDKNKYSGQLYTLPMLQAFNTLDSLGPGMFVTAQGVAISDGFSGNKTVSEIQFPVLFDSGTTFSYLPTEIAEAIGKSFDGKYSSDDQGYIFDCSKVNDTLLSVDFGGFNISANISNFVTSAKDRCVLNVKQSESTYMLGDAFLVDAYVVYDLENYEISIAQASFNNQEEDIEVISDTVPGATPAPGYSSTWVYTPDSPIGTGDFINVSWTSYSEFSQYKSLLATAAQSDDASSFSSSGGSSETTTKKQNAGYKYRSSFSFSLLSFISYFLL
ncbi:BDN_1c_G0027790.mRNA.1.CDS.1 [Saccharomyces cerevisiae]|nr:BDN_1c_G0027790.mRNA.1.CDS.1 [Saccharomyces cerevisiae]CAI7096858.1 BDN_1c_G0027790.mRNA.1.CDS.1 [Saccharomyces cerevisiae]